MKSNQHDKGELAHRSFTFASLDPIPEAELPFLGIVRKARAL